MVLIFCDNPKSLSGYHKQIQFKPKMSNVFRLTRGYFQLLNPSPHPSTACTWRVISDLRSQLKCTSKIYIQGEKKQSVFSFDSKGFFVYQSENGCDRRTMHTDRLPSSPSVQLYWMLSPLIYDCGTRHLPIFCISKQCLSTNYHSSPSSAINLHVL